MDEVERLIKEKRRDEGLIEFLYERWSRELDVYDHLVASDDIELPRGEVKGTLTIPEDYYMGDEW